LQKYYEIENADFKKRVDMMTELLGVKELLHVQVRKLSLGERMKMELMASLLHSPDVIFLDEPTIGLDLVAQENIREFIKEYHRQNNCSILITSHYMADVQALCSRLVLIMNGGKGFDGSLSEFEKILGNDKTVTFNFSQSVDSNIGPWLGLDPKWNDNFTQVELRIPEARLREISTEVISKYNVVDFSTDKMPIERVMKTLMANPKILTDHNAH
jgi:ABC-2 type transport system ATP-binding protein